jgi:membrane protein
MFRNTPAHAIVPILSGLIIAFAGTVAVVDSLQLLYERAFALEPRGWRDIPRAIVWLAVLLVALVAQAAVDGPVRSATGAVGQTLVRLVMETIFFWWTMHFLLAGRASWRALFRPALVTAVLWLCLSLFSSLYFSSVVVSDSRQYGTIGVVFTLLSWFVLIGVVMVLGAVLGGMWQARSERGRGGAVPQAASSTNRT